jgi:ribonuclease E
VPVAEAQPVAETFAADVVPQATPAPVVEVVAEAPAPVVAQAAPVAAAPVHVEAFILPLTDLSALAETAGLQWVNSDTDKIRAVQEAIAAEPKPVHVPRERAAALVLDEGPLVLVETRKDLAQIKLPFEPANAA